MIEMTKKLDLAKCTLGVHVIIKGVGYLLHRHKLVRLRIQHRASPIPIYKKNIKTPISPEIRRSANIPNDAVCAPTDWNNRRTVLGCDLE